MLAERENTGVIGTCYLTCFDELVGPDAPIRKPDRKRDLAAGGWKAGHYLGWTEDLEARLSAHIAGNGSSLMAEVARLGIGWQVTMIWRDVDRNFERRLKRRGSSKRFCPRCTPSAARLWTRQGWVVPEVKELIAV